MFHFLFVNDTINNPFDYEWNEYEYNNTVNNILYSLFGVGMIFYSFMTRMSIFRLYTTMFWCRMRLRALSYFLRSFGIVFRPVQVTASNAQQNNQQQPTQNVHQETTEHITASNSCDQLIDSLIYIKNIMWAIIVNIFTVFIHMTLLSIGLLWKVIYNITVFIFRMCHHG